MRVVAYVHRSRHANTSIWSGLGELDIFDACEALGVVQAAADWDFAPVELVDGDHLPKLYGPIEPHPTRMGDQLGYPPRMYLHEDKRKFSARVGHRWVNERERIKWSVMWIGRWVEFDGLTSGLWPIPTPPMAWPRDVDENAAAFAEQSFFERQLELVSPSLYRKPFAQIKSEMVNAAVHGFGRRRGR